MLPPRVIHQFWGEKRVGPNGPSGGPRCGAWPPGLSTLFGGECLGNAKVRRGLGLVPCLPKSPKAIHTLGIVVCRIINYKGTLVFERGAIYATTFLQRSKIGKVGVSLFISKVYTL